MGRFAEGDAPQTDAVVADAAARIGREIEALSLPALAGVVLGGGYGRGEGGVAENGGIYNDLDFYVVAEKGASAADMRSIAAALESVSREWSARLGADVDFCPPKTPWRLKHDAHRLMVQELVHGYADVAGKKGEVLFSDVPRLDPRDLPASEAERLLMNRGAGLCLAAERAGAPDSDGFAARNINKCVLGAGDALLIARRAYAWRARDRAAALGDPLYSKAVEWKFRPREEPPCSWEDARAIWMRAYGEVEKSCASHRSIRNVARWVARRRTFGALATLGLEPEKRVLRKIARCVAARSPMDESLKQDWKVFN